jgi:hypothetical protein
MQFDIREKNKKLQNSQHLIQSFEVTPFLSLLYTGGKVCLSNNEKFFVSCAEKTANIVDFQSGEVLGELSAVCVVFCCVIHFSVFNQSKFQRMI